MNYTIWIVKSPVDKGWHTRCFSEIALALQSAFRALGYDVPVVTSPSQVKGTAIVLAPHLLAEVTEPLPQSMILYNFEQIHDKSIWLKPQYRYLEYLKKWPVFDYSLSNIQTLQSMGVQRIVHLPVGYAPELTRIKPKPQDIDVLFIGTRHPRREAIVNRLKEHGLKVQWVHNQYGDERDEMIARSKLVLNIHLQPTHLFEIVRVSYLLANRKCVISEIGCEKELEISLQDAVVFTPYDRLVDTCLEYIRDDKKWQAQAQRGFEVFRHQLQAPMLQRALEDMEKIHSKELPHIFVCIASYRDPECQHTVKDMFEKAAHPERVNVGICWQFDPKEDKACFKVKPPRPDQVRKVEFHIKDSKGANWARSQAMKLKEGEEYVLVIDSHMRFEPGWDELLLDGLKRCPGDKAILTAWTPGYKPPNKIDPDDGKIPRLRVSKLEWKREAQIVNLNYFHVPAASVLGKMQPACGCVANCTFAPAAAFEEVPFDPHIDFWGDEVNESARLWTHGWNFFQFDRRIMYHYWDPPNMKDRDTYRDRKNPRHQRARLRNLHLFGVQPSDNPEIIAEIEHYPLGTERSLNDYWQFVGVDLATRTIHEKAARGKWELPKVNKPKIFVNIASYRDPECPHTVNDLFAKAAHPERIVVGICLQDESQAAKACMLQLKHPPQIRIVQCLPQDSKGANWARYQAQQLWRGEEYVLQIDSHMRFEPGWDDMLIGMLERCPSEKPILSTYVPRYVPPDSKDDMTGKIWRIRIHRPGDVGSAQLLHLTKTPVPFGEEERGGLYPSPFCIANFLFCPAQTLQEVPFDPYIQFWGDEITLSARLWTHGYDIFQPDKIVLWHYWRRDELVSIQPYRRQDTPAAHASLMRVKYILGFEATDDAIALAEIERYGLGSIRPIERLWEFAGIDWERRTIVKNSLEGRWNMAARKGSAQKKTKQAAKKSSLPRIFVQIASYRDPDCQNTVKDLFDRAAHPERIFVGICWQFVKTEDTICFQVPYPRPKQVRVKEVHAHESQGVCWARSLAQQLWEDEEFVLQIDSHMRFEPGWDDTLISMWEECGGGKSVLTCYAPAFTPPATLDRTWIFGMAANKFDDDGILTMHGKPPFNTVEPLPPKPIPGAYASAHMLFGPSSMIQDVPYDPHVYFFGEEISMAVRLWTHGYDIYHPNRIVIFHDWDRTKRPTHFSDHRNWGNLHALSIARVKHLLGTERTNNHDALKDLNKFGLGKERTLDEYQRYSGVDFAAKTINQKALEGVYTRYMPSASTGADEDTIFVLIPSYRDRLCQLTIKDLFEKAANPERIFVGICWQFDPEEDKDCFEVPYSRPDQVRVINYHYKDSKGANWARAEAAKLYNGEKYTLVLDAHMRFAQDWDRQMLDMLSECASEKVVLTVFPPKFYPPDTFETGHIVRMGFSKFEDNNLGPSMIVYTAEKVDNQDAPPRPFLTATVSQGFMFARSELFKEVPFDPHIYFFWDEMTFAARLWTRGWDMYSPNRTVIWHFWDRTQRTTHWDDHKNFTKEDYRTRLRAAHLMKALECDDPEILVDLDKYALGTERTLEEYQEYCGVDFVKKTIQPFAVQGNFLPYVKKTPSEPVAAKTTSIRKRNARIFVNIASYRDPECQWTVKDLFEKAANPDRLAVGICWQFDPKEDEHCFQVSTRPEQVRIYPVDWREAEGVCWARHQVQQLWDFEEYTLMIDSHMRFVPGWDNLMIDELEACEADKPLLSCSPARYWPPNKLETPLRPTIRRVKPFMKDGNIRCQGELLDRVPPKPLNAAFMVANFVFSRANVIPEVPYDPYLYFDQEEISYAFRLYTHGWDIFSSRSQFLYHYYNTEPGGSVRPLHWRDLRKEDEPRIRFLRDRGLKRFNHMTGYELSSDPEVIKELDRYGLGKVRTLEQYEAYSGVDFKNKTVTNRALQCEFITDLRKYRESPINIPEIDNVQNKPAAQVTSSAPISPLEVGDFIPFFEATSADGNMRGMEGRGGVHVMQVFLPANNKEYLTAFFHAFEQSLNQLEIKERMVRVFMLNDTVENIKALKEELNITQPLWADPGAKIAASFGLCAPGSLEVPPVGFVLNTNLRVVARYAYPDPKKLAESVLKSYLEAVNYHHEKNQSPRIFTESSPAVIIPGALTPELCRKCIHSFRTGVTYQGTVGAEQNKLYRPDAKIRTDHVLHGALLDEIDDKLSRSVFPELEKVFGFEVKYRELYKIGLYSGEKGGFFRAHRDNYDQALQYRRVAMTIHLNEDYEGGGLRFPEYGGDIYRPNAGAAIAFSGSTFHEALPVTKGERFVLVAFLHSEQDEMFRRYYLAGKGAPANLKDYTPKLRLLGDVSRGRDMYREWQAEYVRYDGTAETQQVAAVQKTEVVNQAQVADTQQKAAEPYALMINTLGTHRPKKVFESKEAVIFDNFLPEDVLQKIDEMTIKMDYEYINTQKVSRAWHVEDKFPLRGVANYFYHVTDVTPKPDWVYPTKTDIDLFMENVLATQPQAEHLVGKKGEWDHFSVTSWIYPQSTGLAMHDDGSGVYTGAYVFFLNKLWKPHWGGLLLVVEEEGNKLVHEYRNKTDQMDFFKKNWLNANPLDELIMEYGFAKCVMPKRNRMVFIANDAYHMVTKVNESAGDNVRRSLAGFFDRTKDKKDSNGQY